MFLRYSASQQKIGQIIESQKFKDIISWDELQQGYGLIIFQSNNFLHSKEYYIKIAKTLPFMMLETLFICSCDRVFVHNFWNHFDCYIPFQQDGTINYFTPNRSSKVYFKNLNELITHVTEFKCNHHRILAKYLKCCVIKKTISLIQQIKDITSNEITYILNTPYHYDEFNTNKTPCLTLKGLMTTKMQVIIQ